MADRAASAVSRSLFVLVGVGIALSVLAAIVSLLPNQQATYEERYGARMLSRTVLGYAGLAEQLRREGRTVLRQRYPEDSDYETGARDTLRIVAEQIPGVSAERREHMMSRIALGPAIVVLPKWRAGEINVAGNLTRVHSVATLDIRSTLRALDPNATLTKGKGPLEWDAAGLRIDPGETEWQLVRSTRFTPIVEGADGMLVGMRTYGRHTLWLVSDPDLLNNRNFADPQQGLVRQALFASAGAASTVVFDETRADAPSAPASRILATLQVPGMIYALVYGLVVLLLALWAATPRFGPIREARGSSHAAGKASLIRTSAGLLRLAGQDSEIIRRYFHTNMTDVARRLHAPPVAGEDALVAFLDRVGKARGTASEDELATLRARVMGRGRPVSRFELLSEARRINSWKRRMLHGPGDNPKPV